MSGFLIPHPEIPNHYEIGKGFHLLTSDFQQPEFKHSRIVRKNYCQSRGFLGLCEAERIQVKGYAAPDAESYPETMSQEFVVEALNEIMVDGTVTIFHYFAQGEVQCVITGVSTEAFAQLSPQYSQYYYEYRT